MKMICHSKWKLGIKFYIPGIIVLTNLPGGYKLANVNSLDKIKHEFYSGLVVCPGHGEMLRLE